MDVDEAAQVEVEITPSPDNQVHTMFAAQFNPFPFDPNERKAIFSRRALMSNELVFDLLLEQASIVSPQSLFPPDSPESLIVLLEAIADCPWDSLKKSCLHFYLLSYVSSEVASRYAESLALPPQFVHLAHACFFLDSGEPEDLARAVALLSDARIVQDLSSKILHTLSIAEQPLSSRLVRTYVRTAHPVLEAFEDLAIYLRALLECNLADAWSFQRTFSETTPIRNQLIRTILDGCLTPPKPSVLPHLLALPLTSFEFSLLQSYALSPPEELTPAAQSILQDLITVRLLHSGKYSDAIRLSRAFDTLNAKTRTGNSASLHRAAEERQQMMRDVLAVIPEVQRRQLELELNDERADGEAGPLGASWASMGSDISMSWEHLATSGNGKAKEKARSGRLEGSPAPKLPGRSNAPNSPFGLFSSSASSSQKRKTAATLPVNVFGTPTSVGSTRPILPIIPTPGLTAGAPLTVSAFHPPRRFGFGATPTRQPQAVDTPNGAHALRSETGINARNLFDVQKPEPNRARTSLLGRPSQAETGSACVNPRDRKAFNGEWPVQPVVTDETIEDEREQAHADVVMVDSDDPDSFVVRGRRRTSFRPSVQTADVIMDANADAGSSSANGTYAHGATLFGRQSDNTRSREPERRKNSPKARVLPGGFTSFELSGATSEPSTQTGSHEQSPKEAARRSSRTRTRTRHKTPEPESQRLKIPGALFDDDDDDAEAKAAEEQDSVPSLPSVPAKGTRRTRSNRASSATESGDDEDAPLVSVRRSSRLSSTGPSPEPPSPQKKTSKRTTRGSDGTGRSTRKRKNAVE